MIRELNLQDNKMVQDILDIQIPAYQMEAASIEYWEIPPLKDTLETLKASSESFYGYFEEEKLLGVIAYMVEGDVMDICRLVVHLDYFRRGIAKKLLMYVETNVTGIKRIKVSTGSKNTRAIKLYKSQGFEECQVVEVEEGLKITEFQKTLIGRYC
ncbi:GNAT family N-acetyltransferase [Anaerosolibacter sp.]|uniref:GNAT family N-acetyltransferase n=1 Tax=Anaerosolibacter sp. TaxID=1872527 RepID=UPI0039F0CDFD